MRRTGLLVYKLRARGFDWTARKFAEGKAKKEVVEKTKRSAGSRCQGRKKSRSKKNEEKSGGGKVTKSVREGVPKLRSVP
jgi:hypothetical protein